MAAAYTYVATGMFDGSLMDTFEEIRFHISVCRANESLSTYSSPRLEKTYYVLNMQRYGIATNVKIQSAKPIWQKNQPIFIGHLTLVTIKRPDKNTYKLLLELLVR